MRATNVDFNFVKRITTQGDSARFVALFRAYSRAPEVTRKRIYLETMSEVLPKVKDKVITYQDMNTTIGFEKEEDISTDRALQLGMDAKAAFEDAADLMHAGLQNAHAVAAGPGLRPC